MKFTISSTAMLGATVLIAKVINSKNPMPILGNILCEVKDNQLTMVGGDGECSIRTNLELQTMEGEGKFCVAAGRLLDALRQMPEQPLQVTCTTESDYMLTIEHQDGTTHFPAESADEYPILDEQLTDNEHIMDGVRIGDAIKRCLWAVCTDDMRPAISGVHICTVAKYNSLDIVGTNGHALVRNRLTHIINETDPKISATIPTKAAKILADTMDQPVQLRFSENKMQVENNRYCMTFRLIADPYVKYNSVIPSDNTIEAIIDKRKLAQGIKCILPFANDSSQLLSLSFAQDELLMKGEDFDFSMGASNRLLVEYNSTAPLTIGLKGSTLSKALSYIDDKDVIIKMKDANSAVLLEPHEQEEHTEVAILMMPMLLND